MNARDRKIESCDVRKLSRYRGLMLLRHLTAGALAASLLVLASPASANADTPGCASASELNQVGNSDRLYSKRRVHRVFDTNGTEDDTVTDPDVRKFYYDQCDAHLDAKVTYARRDGRWRMVDMVA